MNPTVHIRSYQSKDREACIAVFTSNIPLYFDENELTGLELWLDARDQGKKKYAENLSEYYYVVEKENRVIGCGGFYVLSGKKEAGMAWGMVEKAHLKHGIGKQLLEFRLNKITELYPGYKIVLDTSQHTFGFFEKYGFVVKKITKDAYADGLDRYDMEK